MYSHIRAVTAVVGISCACSGGVVADNADSKGKNKTMGLELSWTMKPEGDRLRIDYKVTNHTTAPVIVVEQLLVRNAPDPGAIIVHNDSLPRTVAFTRALVKTDEKVIALPLPVARTLDVGAAATGTAYAALPLRAWHNYSTVPALAADLTQAVLEIGYIDDPGVQLADVKLPSGTVRSPAGGSIGKQKLLRSDPAPLPKL